MLRKALTAGIGAVILSLALAAPAHARHRAQSSNDPGVFDYYALSLSWAPSYCATHPSDPNECATGKKFGFVLHGLWPQFNHGWPQFCSDEPIPPAVKKQFVGIYPSPTLMDHEWTKHGTCSGLGPEGYFQLTKRLKDSVQIPADYQAPAQPFRTTGDQLANAFHAANASLPTTAVLAICTGGDQRYLSEIHICYDKTGAQAIACSDAEQKTARKSCGADFLVRNVK